MKNEENLMIGLNYNDKCVTTQDKPNGHIFSISKSGGGKTYVFLCLTIQAIYKNQTVIAIDVANSYNKSQIPEPMLDFLGNKLQIIDITKGESIPVNPFGIKLNCYDWERCIINSAQKAADLLEENLKLSLPQKTIIYQAYIECAKKYGDVSIGNLYDTIGTKLEDKGIGVSARSVYNKLMPLVDNICFSGETQWDKILYNEPKFIVIQLSELPDAIKKLTTDILLADLLDYISVNGSINKRFVCIIDEIQLVNDYKDSPMGKALTLGRKFGLSLWIATQFLGRNSITVKRYLQAGTKLIFPPTETDIDTIINSLLGKRDNDWRNLIALLRTGMCIVHTVDNASANKLEKIVKVFSIEDIIAMIKTDDKSEC